MDKYVISLPNQCLIDKDNFLHFAMELQETQQNLPGPIVRDSERHVV